MDISSLFKYYIILYSYIILYNYILHNILYACFLFLKFCFYPRDAMLARSLRQRRVRLSIRPSVCPSVTPGIVRKRCILDTKLLWDNRMVSVSMTLMTPDPGFKDTVVLKGEYLQSDALCRHS